MTRKRFQVEGRNQLTTSSYEIILGVQAERSFRKKVLEVWPKAHRQFHLSDPTPFGLPGKIEGKLAGTGKGEKKSVGM